MILNNRPIVVPAHSVEPALSPKLADNVDQASPAELVQMLRWKRGATFDAIDPSSKPGFGGNKLEGKAARAADSEVLSDLQERLYANSKIGTERSMLLVIQGRDTAGKGGIVNHVAGVLSPHGVSIASFGEPTEEEKRHHYLWRIKQKLPKHGQIGVFDRSHYEDILAVRMHNLAPESVWRGRYEEVRQFERDLVKSGTAVVKIMLAVSQEEQYERLKDRLRREDKLWKYSPSDIDDRLRWFEYSQAFSDVMDETDANITPWYVVPADRKWYARWAVTRIAIHHLLGMNLAWPPAQFDVEEERARLEAARVVVPSGSQKPDTSASTSKSTKKTNPKKGSDE